MPRSDAGRRRDAGVAILLVMIVGLETWWILARNPVDVALHGQSAPQYQGPPHSQPIRALSGADRQDGEGQGGNGMAGPIADHGPPLSSFDWLLVGLVQLDRDPGLAVTPEQARALIVLLNDRRSAEADAVDDVKEILSSLSGPQLSLVTRTEAQRVQQGAVLIPLDDLLAELRQAQEALR